jgi:hypothetical protein
MRARTHYVELVFLHPVGFVGHVVLSGVYGLRIVNALSFMPKWDRCGFHRKRPRTCYAKLVFLHPVGSVGHVVHSCVFGA